MLLKELAVSKTLDFLLCQVSYVTAASTSLRQIVHLDILVEPLLTTWFVPESETLRLLPLLLADHCEI